jgi:rare lipoprotein A
VTVNFPCIFVAIVIALLNACSQTPAKKTSSGSEETTSGQRYPGKDKDWGPENEIDMSQVPDAIPRHELRTIAGNKNPYTILGKTYRLLDDERAYKERGKASWYGYKFNGERTSNGELYNMFSMTAAHKTLPIPCYVRVTNLANHNTVVVRVNDRGPFHDDRIIDLSYAAAQRLGITQIGTGDVEVEVLVPNDDPRPPLRALQQPAQQSAQTLQNNMAALPEATYLQIAAFSVEKSAQALAANVRSNITFLVEINKVMDAHVPALYRVRVGPLKDVEALQNAREQLQKMNILQAQVVYQ